jgi:hypothetical protein
LLLALIALTATSCAAAARTKEELPWPPTLPDGKTVVTETSPDFLKGTATILPDVEIAKTPPTVDFLYYPEQNYEGKPWSNWGDGIVLNGKYYSTIGDHGGPPDTQPPGNTFVFEYDPATKALRTVVNAAKVLNLPPTDYRPAKVHGRLDAGDDGWLYFSTHRGSSKATVAQYNYAGDWILRHNPQTGQTEVVAHGPIGKHCIPASVLDPKRLVFYGGTAAGDDAVEERVAFFAYDVRNKKVLYSGPNGCYRYFMFAASTGCVYYEFTNDKGQPTGSLVRYDPDKGGAPASVGKIPGLRAATQETPQGLIYAVSSGQRAEAVLWSFNAKTEEVQVLGPCAVGKQHYITSLDADPTGRYLYYVPGAHGGTEEDGCAVAQYDLKTKKRRVLAFLHPFLKQKYGYTPIGTFSTALDAKGETLYITWHGRRRATGWDTCALTVVHIPESERQP